jgi:hypothetical protein
VSFELCTQLWTELFIFRSGLSRLYCVSIAESAHTNTTNPKFEVGGGERIGTATRSETSRTLFPGLWFLLWGLLQADTLYIIEW